MGQTGLKRALARIERAQQTLQWALKMLGDDRPLIDEYDLTPEEAETLRSRFHTALVELQAILGTALSGKTAASTTAAKPKKGTAKVIRTAAKAEERTPARRGGAGRRESRSGELYSTIGCKGGKERQGSDKAGRGPIPPFGSYS